MKPQLDRAELKNLIDPQILSSINQALLRFFRVWLKNNEILEKVTAIREIFLFSKGLRDKIDPMYLNHRDTLFPFHQMVRSIGPIDDVYRMLAQYYYPAEQEYSLLLDFYLRNLIDHALQYYQGSMMIITKGYPRPVPWLQLTLQEKVTLCQEVLRLVGLDKKPDVSEKKRKIRRSDCPDRRFRPTSDDEELLEWAAGSGSFGLD